MATFSIFNIGGPGWLSDIFEVTITLDTPLSVQEPSSLFIVPGTAHKPDQPTQIVDGSKTVKGNVIIKSPPGHKVGYQGVQLKLTEYCATLNPYITTDLVTFEQNIIGPGTVEGAIYVPFSLELGSIPGLQASYIGRLFSVRHILTATVLRPGWTFPVIAHRAVLLQRCHDASAAITTAPPPLPDLRGAGLGAAAPRELFAECCGSRVMLALTSGCYPLDGEVTGKLRLEGLTSPAVAAAVLIMEVEEVQGGFGETVVLTHAIFGSVSDDSAAAAAAPPHTDDTPSPPRSPHVATVEAGDAAVPPGGISGTQPPMPVAVKLARAPLHPTFLTSMEPGTRGEECALHYQLRLLVVDGDGARHWDTTELVLYRREVGANVRVNPPR